MSRTAPVQIVNKNGVSTTVHKRLETPAFSAQKLGIPMPSIPAPPQDNCKVLVEASFEMSLAAVDMSDNVRAKMMATLHPDTMTRLEDILRAEIPHTSIRRAMGWSMKNRNFALLNTMAVLVPEMDDEKSVNHQDRLMYILTGIQQCRKPRTPEIDITNPDDPRAEAIRPLIRAVLTADSDLLFIKIDKQYQKTITFKDPEVESLIIERPDRAEEIVSLYRSRKSFDREVFETALDSGVPALNEGTL